MKDNETKQEFSYLRSNRLLVAIQWIVMITACLTLLGISYCFKGYKQLPIDTKWYLIIYFIVIVLTVAGVRKLFYMMWSKKECGKCVQTGKSAVLILGGGLEINLDDIIEIGIYDNQNKSNRTWIDVFFAGGMHISPIWMMDPSRGSVCLEIKTKKKDYKFIDRPTKGNNNAIENDGLYKTMRLIKNTYGMKAKQDSSGLPIIDVYISQ